MALTVRQSYLLGTTPEPARTVAPAILRKRVMTSQPQYAAGIDWSNSITRGLVIAHDLSDAYERVGKGMATISGALRYPALVGMARGFNTGFGTGATDYYTSPATANNNQRTYFTRCLNVVDQTYPRLFDKLTAALATTESWIIDRNLGGKYSYGRVFSTTTGAWISNHVVVANAWENVAVRYDASSTANTATFFINGRNDGVAAVTSTPSGTPVSNAAPYTLGIRISDNGRPWKGAIQLFYAWNRLLSDSEIKSLSNNPWQIFLAPNPTPWVVA